MNKYSVEVYDNKIWFKPLVGVAPQVATLGFTLDKKELKWKAPEAYINMASLLEMFPRDIILDDAAQQLVSSTYGFPLNENIVYPESALPHQREAVQFLYSSPRNGSLLCLSPGLGKTYTAIVAAHLMGYKNVLMVSPLILLNTWVEEALKWAGIKVNYCYQSAPTEKYCVTNYHTLMGNIDSYRANSYDLIIFDESIVLKNKSKKSLEEIKKLEASGNTRKKKVTIWQAAFLTRKNATKAWLLSGSPTSKFADDLFGQLHMVDPKVFTSYWRFAERYCHIERDQWGTKIVGTREDRNIQQDLKDYMFVRNKKDVLNLPETYYETIYVTLTKRQQKAYDDLLRDFVAELETNQYDDLGNKVQISVSSMLAQIGKLYQIVAGLSNFEGWPNESAKADVLVELIKNESIEVPCLIWCHYRKSAEALAERLRKEAKKEVGLVLGGTKDRDATIKAFKANELEYMVISLETGKHGLTFTNAKTMVYHDINYNSDAYLQSGERIARIGLEHNPLCIRLHAKGTVEDLIVDNLTNKFLTTANVASYDFAQLLKGLKTDE